MNFVPGRWRALAAVVLCVGFASNALAQTPEQLDALVARIALYPDDLVAIILPGSTVPIQIVEADRYLAKRKSDPKAPINEKWDDSVKALVNYPEVVKAMSSDLDWTSALGQAVTANQKGVLDAVQVFRRKTYAVGNLKTDPKQVVIVEKEVIKIVPADPQVIYVPQYNPTTVVVVGGYSAWGYYPAPYPVYYYPYPPGAAVATGLVWGAAMGAAWSGSHYSYGNTTINVNNSKSVNVNSANINTANINTANVNKANVNSANVNQANVNQAKANQANMSQASSSQWKASSSSQSSAYSSSGAKAGSASSASASASHASSGSSALGGYSSGQQARQESSRGAQSRGSAGGGERSGGGRGRR